MRSALLHPVIKRHRCVPVTRNGAPGRVCVCVPVCVHVVCLAGLSVHSNDDNNDDGGQNNRHRNGGGWIHHRRPSWLLLNYQQQHQPQAQLRHRQNGSFGFSRRDGAGRASLHPGPAASGPTVSSSDRYTFHLAQVAFLRPGVCVYRHRLTCVRASERVHFSFISVSDIFFSLYLGRGGSRWFASPNEVSYLLPWHRFSSILFCFYYCKSWPKRTSEGCW